MVKDCCSQFEENEKMFRSGQRVVPDGKNLDKRVKRRKSDVKLKKLMEECD